MDGQIVRLVALTDLGLFKQAFVVLQSLLHGDRLPCMDSSDFRPTEACRDAPIFMCNLTLTHADNLKVIQRCFDYCCHKFNCSSLNKCMLYEVVKHVDNLSLSQHQLYTIAEFCLPFHW